MLSDALMKEIGDYIGTTYEGHVSSYMGTLYLVYKTPRHTAARSMYTLNLKTLNPTKQSPIQTDLTIGLIHRLRDELRHANVFEEETPSQTPINLPFSPMANPQNHMFPPVQTPQPVPVINQTPDTLFTWAYSEFCKCVNTHPELHKTNLSNPR